MRGHPHGTLRASTGRLPLLVLLVLAGVAGGCAQLGQPVDLGVPGIQARWLRLPGIDGRRALIASPETVSPNRDDQNPVPLVIAVHGVGSSAEQMVGLTGWAAEASRRGFVAAFPQGKDASFNAGRCCGPAAENDVDDIDFLNAVIDEVSRRYPIDAERVYLTGYSNGGMLTYRYLCTDADRLAGAASVNGTNAAGCEPSGPVPFLQISGVEDAIVPVEGGASEAEEIGELPAVTESVEGVAAAMGCPADPVVTDSGKVESRRWSPCDDGVTVGLDLIEGLNHGYPTEGEGAATPAIADFWGL